MEEGGRRSSISEMDEGRRAPGATCDGGIARNETVNRLEGTVNLNVGS